MADQKKVRTPTISRVRVADAENVVVSTEGADMVYRRKPCAKCPWRQDAVGEFPSEAFRLSANTAYDMADRMFGCHESKLAKPAACAGFLLRGAEHNMLARFAQATGDIGSDVSDGGLELYENYRAMAIANGVDPRDPVLAPCCD